MPPRSPWLLVVVAIALPALLLGTLLMVLLIDEDDTDVAVACLGGDIDVAVPEDWPQEVAGYTGAQLVNAGHIMSVASERGLGARAATIALMTALTESSLRNLANAGDFTPPAGSPWLAQWPAWREVAMLSLTYPNDGAAPGDWDSVGLFQQRPSQGWGGSGSDEEQVQNLLDPEYAAGAFLDSLVDVEGWQQLPLGAAAQAVQRSAFPDAYANQYDDATAIVEALSSQDLTDLPATGGSTSCAGAASYDGTVASDGWVQPVVGARYTSGFGVVRSGYTHMGSDFAAPAGTPIYAAADGVVAHVSCDSWRGRSPCNILVDHGLNADGQRVQTLYVHMYANGVLVDVGDAVSAGDHIADVGSNGNSTGPHLHFEVWIDEQPIDAVPFLAGVGITM